MSEAFLDEDQIRMHGVEVFSKRIPFNDYVGFELDFTDVDSVVVRFSLEPQLVGNFMRGILHGGVTSAALDVVGGVNVFTHIARRMPDDMSTEQLTVWFSKLATIDLRVDFLRPGAGTEFTASARILRAGKRIAFVNMALHNEEGVQIAAGSGTYTLAEKVNVD